MRERLIWGVGMAAVFLPFLIIGGLPFQLLVASLAGVAMYEMLKMRGLEPFSLEGALSIFAAIVLTLPLQNYFGFLPIDANWTVFGLMVFIILSGTVFQSHSYSFEDAAYPIAASFYVGFGFHNLINARIAGFDKVFFALLIIWATDIGAYVIGRQIGQRKLLPQVSPNKTVEGSLGGMASAFIVALIFMIFDRDIYEPHHFLVMCLLVLVFSAFAQFGDLVESALKRHFGVKDSNHLIPGHGGILDRCDSWLFVLPIMHFFGLF